MRAPGPPQDDEGPRHSGRHSGRLGAGGWLAIIVLFGLLVWAGWYAVRVWSALPGVTISPLGWLFIGLTVAVTVALGAGLMALVFYSSRHHDDGQ